MIFEELRFYCFQAGLLKTTQEQLKIYKSAVLDNDRNEGIKGEADLLNIIPNFSDKVLLRIRKNISIKKIVTNNDSESPDIEKFKYDLPHFGLIFSINSSENTQVYRLPYRNYLEVTIRGIYDSKYYEHLMCTLENDKIPSKFVDFVYGWLSMFVIDNKYRELRLLPSFTRGDEKAKKVFLAALADKNAKKS